MNIHSSGWQLDCLSQGSTFPWDFSPGRLGFSNLRSGVLVYVVLLPIEALCGFRSSFCSVHMVAFSPGRSGFSNLRSGLWFLLLRPPLRPFVDFKAPSVQFTWCSAPFPWILANWWNFISCSWGWKLWSQLCHPSFISTRKQLASMRLEPSLNMPLSSKFFVSRIKGWMSWKQLTVPRLGTMESHLLPSPQLLCHLALHGFNFN